MKFDGMPLASTNQLGISQADSYLPGLLCVWWEQVVEGTSVPLCLEPIEFPKAMGVPMVDALDPQNIEEAVEKGAELQCTFLIR